MRPLRIAIDARELLGARTGVGRYLAELMTRWTRRTDAASRELVLYTPSALLLAFPGARERILGGGSGTWWEQTRLARAVRADDPDVFFAPAYTAPLRLPSPLAVAIHDVSFSRHPEWFRPRERHRRHLLTRSAARLAGVVLTGAAFSRREIVELYRIPDSRVEIIPYGITARRRPDAPAREPLVLFAGSIFNRRRLPDLIAAMALVIRTLPSARLVVAGDNRTWPTQDLRAAAAEHGIAGRVEIRDYVPEEELDALYARASVFAFLSEYEGFGFTPLEALGAGVPIVVLDTPIAREVYGAAAEFVAVGDVRGAAAALVRLMMDREAAAAQLARGREVLRRYSWDVCAERTLAAIERVARR